MKRLKYLLTTAFALVALTACDLLKESAISGVLTINPKSGWSELEFVNEKTKAPFKLQSGRYKFEFVSSWMPFTDPRIKISNPSGVVGELTIPRKMIKPDGTFEVYMNQGNNRNSFNILGGRRVTVIARDRFVKMRAHCTYTETYSCEERDSDGKVRSTVCTRQVDGNQDQLWERQKKKSLYRILFDGGDLVNVADFSGESQIRTEDELIYFTNCR